jgi:hypothetical protein
VTHPLLLEPFYYIARFKASGMMNLQYEIRICHKIQNKDTNTIYYLFKWDRR